MKRGRLATEKHLICCVLPTVRSLGQGGQMQRRWFGNLVVRVVRTAQQDEVTS